METRREMIAALEGKREKPLLEILREFSLQKQKKCHDSADSNTEKSKVEDCADNKPLKLKFKSCGDSNFVKVNLCDSSAPAHYVKCPISDCQHSMDPIDVMAHYVTQHKNLKVHRIFDDDSTEGFEIKLNPYNLPKYDSVCLAVLAFAGKVDNKKKNKSVAGYRKVANDLLPKRLHHLTYDLPVLIMASRNCVGLPPRPGHEEKRFPRNMVVVWPATVDTQSNACHLYCWIMAKNMKFMERRSTLVDMRSFEESQDPSNLLIIDNCTFHFNMREMDQMMSRGKPLTLQIKCKLYETNAGAKMVHNSKVRTSDEKSRVSASDSESDNESNRTFVIE